MSREWSLENEERTKHLKENPIIGPDDPDAEDFGDALSSVTIQTREEQARRKEAEVKDVDKNFQAFLDANSETLGESKTVPELIGSMNGRYSKELRFMLADMQHDKINGLYQNLDNDNNQFAVVYLAKNRTLNKVIIDLEKIVGATQTIETDPKYKKDSRLFLNAQFENMGMNNVPNVGRYFHNDAYKNLIPAVESDLKRALSKQ